MKQTAAGVEFSTTDNTDRTRALDLFNAMVYARIDGFRGAVPTPNEPLDQTIAEYRQTKGNESVLVIPESEVGVAKIVLQNLVLLDDSGRINPSLPENVEQFIAELSDMYPDTPVH